MVLLKIELKKRKMIPVRCVTCNKVIANLYLKYIEECKLQKEHPKDILTKYGIKKYCCRKTFITNIS